MVKKLSRNKGIGVLLIAFLACGIIMECLPQSSATGSWLDGYANKKTQTIIGSTGAGYNYQLYYKVYRTAGVDSGNTVYLAGKCKTDFSDVRFTDTQTPPNVFNYWIAKKTSDYAEFWVNASTLDLDNNSTIAIYYGNPAATDASSFETTFVFGELWDNATFNTAKWTSSGSTPSVTIDTIQHRATITCSSSGSYYSMINLPDNYMIEDAYTYQGSIYLYNTNSDPSVNGNIFVGTHHGMPSYSDWLTLGMRFYRYTVQQPYEYYMARHLTGATPYDSRYGVSYQTGSITVSFRLWHAGTTNVIYDTVAGNTTGTSTESPNKFVFGASMSSGWTREVLGAFKIRKYVENPPVQSTWSSEETPSTGTSVANIQVFWNTGGSGISINGQTVTQNGTWVACQGNITIGALTKSSTYLFKNITISNATSNLLITQSNPATFTLPSENISIWCNYAAVGSIQPYIYARFTFTPSNPTAGSTTIALNAALSVSNEPIYSYVWNFGDNATSTEISPSHIYAAVGTYIITLTVTSDAGSDTIAQQINVS